MPDTTLGLILFVAAIGPGYVFVRVAELRRPQGDPSAFREVAELLLAGSATTAFATAVVLGIAEGTNVLNAGGFLVGGRSYFVKHTTAVLLITVFILVVSYGSAWVAAHLLYWRQAPTLNPRASVWYAAVQRARNVQPGRRGASDIPVTVELVDGRIVAGHLQSYEAGIDAESRDICILYPWVKVGGAAEPQPLNATLIVIPGAQIVALSLGERRN